MQLSNMNVFPLVKHSNYLAGYFMSADGSVWSNKNSRNGTLTKLSGSRTPSGIYYTLNKRSYSASDLANAAKRHPAFAGEVAPKAVAYAQSLVTPVVVTAHGAVPAGNKSRSAGKLLATKGFVIATVNDTDKLVFGTDPIFQLDEQTATTEAERIANLHPGKRVVLLKAYKSVVAGTTKWD